VVVLVALGLAAVMLTAKAPLDTANDVVHVVHSVATNLPNIAERFKTGTITHTFHTSLPEIHGTGGDILELAVSESEETFQRTDSRSVFWNSVYLGTTTSEVRVPVTFRYHLRLSDPWRLSARDQVCLVLAPSIRPSLPPAIHTDRMVKRTERGWARFNESENLTKLERSLTPTLNQRASDPARMNLIRENCRHSVAAFVRRWLMREDHWRTDRFTAITVVFADELPAQPEPDLENHPYQPTIELTVPGQLSPSVSPGGERLGWSGAEDF
jgi:hypothetical protein